MGILVILFEALLGEVVVWDRKKESKPILARVPEPEAGEGMKA
jgi:uncharacterized Tic20 family protein